MYWQKEDAKFLDFFMLIHDKISSMQKLQNSTLCHIVVAEMTCMDFKARCVALTRNAQNFWPDARKINLLLSE